MMKTSVRKIAAALTVAAISGSFSVYAENNDEGTIQFSAYKVAAGTEDRVSAEFSTTFANVDLESGSWINNLLRGGATGSYNGGTYLYSQGDNTAESITVTLNGVESGYYTFKQFDVAAASSALDITVSSGNESYEYTTAPTQSGEFMELGTKLLLGGEVTIVYRAASIAAIRIDETQLIMTESIEPSVTEEPSTTEQPSPTPDTSTPAPTIDPGDIPENLSPSKVSDVQLTGQLVEADGLEGLAVDGTCEVTYKFESENGENDNGALIRWYRALTKDGEYTEIDGSTGSPYTITEELGGYFVKAGVSVVTDKDTVTEEIFTDPMQVKYRLAFYDDFDYTAASGENPAFIEHGWTSDKSIRVLGSPTVYCARVPENITVEDGLLKITTRKEHLDKYNELDYEGKPHTWTTGSIWTTEAYGPYGVYEASYKLTDATGLNQSFWSMVRQPSSAENGFIEMDFNEGHYPYEIATNLHRSTGSGTVTTQNSIKHYPLGNTEGCETLADNFNRYTGMLVENDWNYTWDSQQNSDTYQVFFNNKLLRKTRSLQYTASPVSIFFSVAVYPGTFTGPLVDEDADGSVMEVDWVRYYEFLGTTEAELDAEIMKAEGYLRDAVVGDQTGNYPQQSVDELKVAVETARSILGTGAETETLDAALDALKTAEGIFLRSVVGGYYVNVESISFDEKEVSILIEKTKKLNVNIYPEDANNKNVKFTSSSANIAAVSADGVLTALSPGTTVITAKSEDGGFEAQCTVTVTALPDNQVFYEVEGGKLIFDKDKKEIIDYVGSPTVIVIPSRIENVKVEGIAINTFKELTTLKELRIKKGLQSIGDWSFVGCTALESVQLPDSLVSINTSSFQGCESLTELTIPSSVKNIEDGAFSLCPKLEKVTFNGNAPEETGRFIFGDDNNVTVYFYKGAQGFTAPEWNGYPAVELDGEPIPVPEPVLTSIELTGGRDSTVRGFTLTPFTARAYDDIGDEITDIDFVWSVTGNATVENGIVTIGENAKNGETVIVKAEGTYNGKTMSAEKTITIGDTLKFSFGSEYIKYHHRNSLQEMRTILIPMPSAHQLRCHL